MRKLCASCEEEVNTYGNTAVDADGLGYCTGYGKDATVSGLLVIPTDAATGQTVIPGPLTVSCVMYECVTNVFKESGMM